MGFVKELPMWNAPGIKPPLSKLNIGWEVEDHPPADWLNWQQYTTYEALKELQEQAADKSYVDQKISELDINVTPEQIGAAKQSDFAAHLAEDASLTKKGHVQLSSSVTSTSETLAATANAVKQVNDKLVSDVVAMGKKSSSDSGAVAIGQESNAYLASIALGGNAKTTKAFGIAIGPLSSAEGAGSVALGSNATALNNSQGILGSGNGNTDTWLVPGSFSVQGTKNFEIPHPHPVKKNTHVIRHGAVESPTPGDTLYRYTLEATKDSQTVEIHLPDYFEHLNTNVDVWVNGHLHFGRAYGVVEGDTLKVTCEKAGKYKALVIGTRNDDNVQDWHVKGVEREIGESWRGETYVFEVDEIMEVEEITNMEESV
ncbi:hypothetical protein E0485_15240 [Paenibacillus albiflavus]|uniref:Trimeric autotransporter adhesin YadA-like head domain-containing protein n=1 Tax=Paenibacillus albiflavus TaxID=2545760 RepID=A0A4R4E9E8_9BACL|nr:tail fiber protein [Paenibacillus albiflavus]TCZ76189.1 hypothetical protein E0485_15240 [Paenibacillus albiflavus]